MKIYKKGEYVEVHIHDVDGKGYICYTDVPESSYSFVFPDLIRIITDEDGYMLCVPIFFDELSVDTAKYDDNIWQISREFSLTLATHAEDIDELKYAIEGCKERSVTITKGALDYLKSKDLI